jgi:uncharacterized protein with PQ loop repeat
VPVGDLFSVLAVAASIAFVWPQVVRLARRRDTDGVSALSALWACAAYTLWTAYGIRADLPAITVANAQLAVGFAIVLVLVARFGPVDRRLLPATVVVAAVVLTVSVAAPAAGPGVLAVVVGSSAFLPQAWVALRVEDLSGVSVATYLLVAAASACWLGFGIAEADPIVIVPSMLIIPVALTVAIRADRSHRRGDTDDGPSDAMKAADPDPEPAA